MRKPKQAVAAALLASDKGAAKRIRGRKRLKATSVPCPLKPFGPTKGSDGKYRYGGDVK